MSPAKTAPATGALNLKQLTEVPQFIDMVYLGEPGSGKTTAAAHMASLGPVVWVCGEMGLEIERLREMGVPVENIRLHDEITYDALNELHEGLRAALRKDPTAYAGVVFDTFSEIQGKLLEVKAKALLISQNEYGVNTSELTRLLRKYTDLPCHTAYVTHTKRIEDKKDETVTYKSMMTPKVASALEGYTRIICHMVATPQPDSDEADYIGYLRPHFSRAGKDRTGTLPPKLYKPDFDRIDSYVSRRYLRAAINQVDASGEVPDGLDPLQYDYLQRVRAQKAQSAAAKSADDTDQGGQE